MSQTTIFNSGNESELRRGRDGQRERAKASSLGGSSIKWGAATRTGLPISTPRRKMQRGLKTVTLNERHLALALAAIGILFACSAHVEKRGFGAQTDLSPISPCALLANIDHYRGKIVAVRGIYWYGLREACPEPLVMGRRAWPTALNLVDSASAKATEPVGFTTNRESWDYLDRVMLREAQAGLHGEIWVTMTGVLQAPREYVREDGSTVAGYGHLGAFPAQLVVEQASDIVIEHRPTYDYGEAVRTTHER